MQATFEGMAQNKSLRPLRHGIITYLGLKGTERTGRIYGNLGGARVPFRGSLVKDVSRFFKGFSKALKKPFKGLSKACQRFFKSLSRS
jgi:hypothetical protein